VTRSSNSPVCTIGMARLRSLGVIPTPGENHCATPLQIVTRLGALQGQDYPGVLWSIGLRALGTSEAVIEAAFARREIVRTWPMRGTLHVIPAADARWMLELLTPRVFASTASRRANLTLDEDVLARAAELIRGALRGGNRLTRAELMSLLEAAGISTAGQRGYHVLFNLSMRRLIVFGPRDGKEHTFVLFDEWLPDAVEMPADAALVLLTRRYFTGHGPATAKDFSGWSGLTMAEVHRGLEAAAADLVSLELDGVTYWMSATAADEFDEVGKTPDVRLLPGFDEFVLGYKDRSAVLAAEHSGRIVPGNNGVFRPTVVIDGRVAGTWSRVVKRKAPFIDAMPFTRFTAAQQRAIDAAAQTYLDFSAGAQRAK